MSIKVRTILQDPGTGNLNEFFLPSILDLGLEKTLENRSPPEVESDDSTSRQNGVIAVPEEDEELIEMSPKKKAKRNNGCKQHSSFLLQPFLKPVDPHIESNKENPVLKALFGGKSPPGLSPWTFVTNTSINNCHPFKKTELSHDFVSDDTPAEIPKSLLKKSSPTRKKSTREECPIEAAVESAKLLKEIQLDADVVSSTGTASVDSSSSVDSKRRIGPSAAVIKASKFDGASLLNKRKRIGSQMTLSNSKPRLSYINNQKLIQLRGVVDNAVKNHKVYSMTGCYNSVRNALKQRGWIEKIDSDVKGRRRVNKFEEIGLCQGEAEIMNRMLKNVTEDLCWLSRPFPYYSYKDFDKFNMINRLPRAYFSNKVGLCNSLQQIQWFYEPGVCSTQFPRTYNTSVKDELQAFKDDFRLTACIGLLKWFSHAYNNGGEKAVRASDGKVELNVIEFSLRRCTEFVKTKQHEDIDISEPQTVWEYQWDNFITQYYKVVNDGQILKDNRDGISIKAIASNVQSMLHILKPYWPQYDIEGHRNFWIVKPGGRCCGAGIVIKNHLEHILGIVNPSTVKETRYVVQKYIERPLLIYNTKFDIRQWFLVTNVYPLTVWMYKESYLRFCSQPFTLNNTHESIHLCNNAVQKKYKNGKRDPGLPEENMWDCYTFQTYLKAIGQPEAWEKYIYPGMKESFVGALLASQDSMERKRNCFELYGADFMVSEILTDGPWLIEINSNPAMDSSTSVTARMCPQVLEDIIKVVIDRRDNKSASTGAFEMVYKQNCPPVPPYLGMSLCIKGKKAYKSNGDSRFVSKKSKSKNSTESLLCADEKKKSTSGVIARTEIASYSSSSNSSADKSVFRFFGESQTQRPQHREVDWVTKNINDLKRLRGKNQSKNSIRRTPGTQAQTKKPTAKEGKQNQSKIFNLFSAMEVKRFAKDVLKIDEDKKFENDAFVSDTKIQRESFFEKESISDKAVETLRRLLEFDKRETQETKETTNDSIQGTKESNFRFDSKPTADSCPNFSETLKKEHEKLDGAEKKASEESMDSFFSASSYLSTAGSKTCPDYYRDRRCKLTEAQSLSVMDKVARLSRGESDLKNSRRFKDENVTRKGQTVQKQPNAWLPAEKRQNQDKEFSPVQELELRGKSIESRHQIRVGLRDGQSDAD